jgi:hypothetical protein
MTLQGSAKTKRIEFKNPVDGALSKDRQRWVGHGVPRYLYLLNGVLSWIDAVMRRDVDGDESTRGGAVGQAGDRVR